MKKIQEGKIRKKFQNEIFEQCNSAAQGGYLWDFLTSIVLQNIETMKGRPFDAIQKISKKVAKCRKKSD